MQNQKAVTAYFSSKQLLPFGFAGRGTLDMLIPAGDWGPLLTSSDPPPPRRLHMPGSPCTINPEYVRIVSELDTQSQKTVAAYFSSEQLLSCGFT